MFRAPPNKLTFTLLSVKLFKIDATTDAHAPVPQARVIPQPLSQTLKSISLRDLTLINSTFVFSGKISWCSNFGPTFLQVLTSRCHHERK